MINDPLDATTHGVRLTQPQLTAVIDLIDDHLATQPYPVTGTGPSALREKLRLMYLEHARGRFRATLGQARAGAPTPLVMESMPSRRAAAALEDACDADD